MSFWGVLGVRYWAGRRVIMISGQSFDYDKNTFHHFSCFPTESLAMWFLISNLSTVSTRQVILTSHTDTSLESQLTVARLTGKSHRRSQAAVLLLAPRCHGLHGAFPPTFQRTLLTPYWLPVSDTKGCWCGLWHNHPLRKGLSVWPSKNGRAEEVCRFSLHPTAEERVFCSCHRTMQSYPHIEHIYAEWMLNERMKMNSSQRKTQWKALERSTPQPANHTQVELSSSDMDRQGHFSRCKHLPWQVTGLQG